ncbi:MAG: DUF4357 domain-containing protein [Eubacterium sp.]
MTAREIVYKVLMVIARRQGFILSRDVENACIETDLGLIDTEWISSHIIQEDIPILDEEPRRQDNSGDKNHNDEVSDVTSPSEVTDEPQAPAIQRTGRSTGAIPDGIYYCRGKGFSYEARMEVKNGSYILLKGSRIKRSGGVSLRKKLQQIRSSPMYIKDYVVIQDIYFGSPSSAADIVTGSSTNGWIFWTTEDGMTIDNLRSR